MSNISMNQALDIWSELWQAYYGHANYGGDTAEIYAYRLMPYKPLALHEGERLKSAAKAANSLACLLIKFETDNRCRIEVDGKSIRDWVESEIFDHRCHVTVRPLESD